jgi:sodium/potassium/calcium exchanger 6
MAANLVCDQATIFSTILSNEDKCKLLSKVCAENQEGLINFYEIYLCYFQGSNAFFGLCSIITILLCFKVICSTIEDYVAPAIVFLSRFLELSEALAGVTLLAFANGAGDVITAIVASGSKDGISYNVGALYGAGFFVLTLVVALTILNSETKIKVEKSVIFRDIGFYILATCYIIGVAYYGEITWFLSLGMLLLYGLYVGVVLI